MGIDKSHPKEILMTTRLRILAVAALAALLSANAVQAETVVLYREGQRVDPHEVARVLGGVKTRGLRLLDDGPGAPAAVAAPAAAPAKVVAQAPATKIAALTPVAQTPSDLPDAAEALSLPVRFAFASAEILPPARAQLDALAEGIKLLPAENGVMVEGHTDAAGPDAYNLELSRERARAVRDYLVLQHGISATRLKTAGYGETKPLEDTDPTAAVNRRVQFRGI